MTVNLVDWGDEFLFVTRRKRQEMNWKSLKTDLKGSSGSHVFLALTRHLRLRPVQLASFLKEIGLGPSTSTSKAIWHLAHDHFHHGQVLKIVMSLKECNTRKKLDENAAQ
jgi:hypothetical protein